jgi:hypothetical protein
LAEANPEVEFIKVGHLLPAQIAHVHPHARLHVLTHLRPHQVDVDENEEVASACAIQSMPTFHFYKNVSAAQRTVPAFGTPAGAVHFANRTG